MEKARLISLSLTVFLIALIVSSSPISGITVLINNLAGTYNKGSKIDFTVTVNISSSEQLPINYANITFTHPDSSNSVCQVYLNKTVYGCDFLTVNSIDFDSLTYGYGYGYGYEDSYGYSLGYGYGYAGSGQLTLNLTLDTSSLATGDHNAKVEIYAGVEPQTHVFKSSTIAFTISQTTTTTVSGGGFIFISNSIIIKEAENKTTQRGMKEYQVKVQNNGNMDLEKVYLLLSLPEGAYTANDVISLKAGEEGILNYTLNLPPGDYSFTITAVGETGERRTEDSRYVELQILSEEVGTTTTTVPEGTPGTPNPMTGFVTGVGNFASNYWYILLGMITLAAFVWLLKAGKISNYFKKHSK